MNHAGNWPAKLVSAKYRAVDGAKRVVDLAMDVSAIGNPRLTARVNDST